MRQRSGFGPTDEADKGDFSSVKIDVGEFKYVLIAATNPLTAEIQYLVRGNLAARYHKDAAKETAEALASSGWPYRILGGGRIRHAPESKSIFVYGHSYGFPWQVERRFAQYLRFVLA
jgi:hypothetical protein